MIPYLGTPITPNAILSDLQSYHGLVSFWRPDQIERVASTAQSFALDNGAFSAWTAGRPVSDWEPYYAWCAEWLGHPGCDFAIVPDVIDGGVEQNNRLEIQWPFGTHGSGAPVWHLHEPINRLTRMARNWHRVCLGSSGEYAVLKTARWWSRMHEAFEALCGASGRPMCKVHGLRMADPEIVEVFPFASVDSTNVARNHARTRTQWSGSSVGALLMAQKIDAIPASTSYRRPDVQLSIFA